MNKTDVGHIVLILLIVAGLVFVSHAAKAQDAPQRQVENTNIQSNEDADNVINTGPVSKSVKQNNDGSFDLR